MSPWLIGVATTAVAIIVYHLLKLITRSSLPLPPGPRPWPIVGNLPHMGRMPHQTFATLAQTYGPLMYFRLGSIKVVVVASASMAEQFLKVHDANFSNRPVNSTFRHIFKNVQDFAFAPCGPRWRLLRKISSGHMFSVKALDGFRSVREEEVQRLACNIASSDSKAVNLAQLVNVCTTNLLARIMFGRRLFNDDINNYDPRADDFKSMVDELMVLLGIFNISDFIPALDWLDLQGVKPRADKLSKRFDAFLSNILEEHKISMNSEKYRDLYLTTLLSLKDTPQEEIKLTEAEIKLIIWTMFGAGTDTPTSVIEWAIAEMIRNPTIMNKVQQELDNVVGRDRLVTEQDLPQLPYLQAVVKETFRLHPPTPLSLPRVAEESCEIFGYHIPKNATVLINVWAIGRDPKEWLNPSEFKPERFLSNNEKDGVDVRGNNFEILPFGAGRRICAGMNLGIRVVQLLVATLTHAFDWELENGLDPEKLNMDEVFALTLQRAVPLSIHPHPRLSQHAYSSSSSSSSSL